MGTPLLASAAAVAAPEPPEPARGALPGVEAALRLRSELVRVGTGCPGLASGGLPVGDCSPLGSSTDRPASHLASGYAATRLPWDVQYV